MKPKKINKNLDYFCTWQSQCTLGYLNSMSPRDYLDEFHLFNKDNGIANNYKDYNSNLIFILDDGWDVSYDANNIDYYRFSSFNIRNDKFPSFKGSELEKLSLMVKKIKELGWYGLGLWVAADGYNHIHDKSKKEIVSYLKEKMILSKKAGVIYWKLDWGKFDNDAKFRNMLNKAKNEVYPELIIENAMCISPVNGYKRNEDKNKKYRYPWNLNMIFYLNKVLSFSLVFRSYDVNEEQSTVTTLERLSFLLKKKRCLINCEDEIFIGATLGLSLGIQRAELLNGILDNKYSMHNNTCEVKAFINYRKIAKPFIGGKLYLSKDEFKINYQYKSHWAKECDNENICQIAPSIISRNITLPKVIKIKEQPFVLASFDPDKNFALCTLNKYNYNDLNDYEIDVNCMVKDASNIAIFSNHLHNAIFIFNYNLENISLSLFNLYDEEKINILDYYFIKDNILTINYQKIMTLSHEKNKAFLIKIKKNNKNLI